MKKSLNAWTLERKLTFEESFATMKKAGFDGIELNLDRDGASPHAFSMQTTAEEIAAVRRLSEQYELPVVSISTSLSGRCGNPDAWDEMHDVLMKQIELAKGVGASGVLHVPGGMGETITLDAARKNAIAFFKKYREEIEASGITVGLENVWNGFFLSPYDMSTMIDEIGSPAVGAYLDVGNMIAFSVSEYWVEVLGERIKYVHVKDYKRNGGLNSGGTWQDITHGTADWEKIIPALRKAGFDGYLTGEVGNSLGIPMDEYYAKVAGEIGTIIGY
ncbi:MAG: sugar phosphate isomerase/epimerase [Clostridia bacterium]|nr:sugar phosphate isomerase/epimerase [Clostridia bacterium]